jgi:FkbM family methyltransferase
MTHQESSDGRSAGEHDEPFRSFFRDLLRDDPILTIVDVGAQDLKGESHIYSSLTRAWPHRVIGFEPVFDEEIVEQTESGVRRVLPCALGDGEEHTLNVTHFSALSSFYKPNRSLRSEFHGPKHFHEVVKTVPMQTRALDALELEQADFIKLDTQGAEPLIVKGGMRYVSQTPLVYSETMFVPLYEQAPLFDEHLRLFRAYGFELFDLYLNGRRRAEVHAADAYPALAPQGGGRLVWADALYGQRWLTGARPSPAQRQKALKAALLLHCLFKHHDVVARILELHAGEACCRDYVGMIKSV